MSASAKKAALFKQKKISVAENGTYHVVHSQFLQSTSNLMLEEIVRSKGIDVDVFTHRNELRSSQVVESDIVVEKLGHSDDVALRGFLSSRSDLGGGVS